MTGLALMGMIMGNRGHSGALREGCGELEARGNRGQSWARVLSSRRGEGSGRVAMWLMGHCFGVMEQLFWSHEPVVQVVWMVAVRVFT